MHGGIWTSSGFCRTGARDRGWSVNGSLQPSNAALHAGWTMRGLDLRSLNFLPPVRDNLEVKSQQLTAQGRLDGDPRRREALGVSAKARMENVDVAAPAWGTLSAGVLELGPLS